MAEVACVWQWEVERGPDWLFVRVKPPLVQSADSIEFASAIWNLLEQHFTYRLVLEMEDVEILPSYLIGQIILIGKRIYQQGGMLRLSGLRPACEESLRLCRLDGRFPSYRNRAEAVLCSRPPQPR